ncbi:MAG: Peptidyl-prolyl cis-trans isomerase Mip [Candidatus Anoxychlamydiales bacterium]|nr:Peptidyl-prolyl cis-trans isomerase Mip [Candidatus Anoxychlamydiales bacterium]
MKKFIFIFLISFSLYANEDDIDIKKLSEAIGHIIGKSLDDIGIKLDLKKVVKGIKKAKQNKEFSISEDECLKALVKLQKKEEKVIAQKNLNEANEFLSKNKTNEEIILLEDGKIQYQVLNKGNGNIVKSYNKPIVKLNGKYLNNAHFLSTEELVDLNEIDEGLRKSIIGMQENEKRRVYIHPELTDNSKYNKLLIYDIEIIKSDINSILPKHEEIADQSEKILR